MLPQYHAIVLCDELAIFPGGIENTVRDSEKHGVIVKIILKIIFRRYSAFANHPAEFRLCLLLR